MRNQIRENQNEVKPIILTVLLIVTALIILFVMRQFPNTDLWISIVLYVIIDIGFLIAMFLGIKTKKMPIIIFSVISNSIFFLLLSIFIFFLAIANGISEP